MTCRTDRPASDFWKMKASKDGLQNRCKPCTYAYRRDADRRYISSGKHATKQREGWYRRTYGISVKEVDELYLSQGKQCAICGKAGGVGRGVGVGRGLHLDHCHKTGKIRGLLCGKCNRALGWLNDDPAL